MPALKSFDAIIAATPEGRAYLPLPFEPGDIWGGTPVHLGGAINAMHFRGRVEAFGAGKGLVLTPMWLRACGLSAGDRVSVILAAEGPLRSDMAPDLAEALGAEPAVAAFWETLAQFYRKAYVRWIDGTKGKPDLRAARIAEVVGLLKAGVKARPRTPGR